MAANSAQLFGGAHIDATDGLQPRFWRLDPHSRGVSPLTTQRQNLLLGGEQKVLVQGSAWTWTSTHLPPPVMIDKTADRAMELRREGSTA